MNPEDTKLNAKSNDDIRPGALPTPRPLQVEDVVRYKDGHVRIKTLFKTHATLCPIFGGRIIAKKVPLSELTEDREAWYEAWTQSETYRCM